MFAADRVLDGDALYAEIVELNPPLVVYLSAIPVALAGGLGVPVAAVLHGCLALLVVAALLWGQRLVRAPPLAAALAAVVLCVQSRTGWGQREHVMVICTLPYFATILLRSAGAPPRSLHAFGVGLLAAVGFALKPHFLLAPLLVRAGIAVQERKMFTGRRAEHEGLFLGLLVYGLHFFVVPFRADFVTHVELVREVYSAFDVPLGEFFGRPWGWQAVLWTIGTGLLALLAWRGCPSLRWIWLAQVGFLAAAVVQAKGFRYHVLPVELTGWFAILVFVFAGSWQWLRSTAALGILSLGAMALGALHLGQHWLQRHPESGAIEWSEEFTGIPPDCASVRDLKAGDSLLVLDTDIHTFFAWMLDHEIGWASRYACLWPLPGGSELRRGELRRHVVEDLRRGRPALVFVRRGQPSFCDDSDFDVLSWLRGDPGFEAEWARYERVGESSRFRVYRRR